MQAFQKYISKHPSLTGFDVGTIKKAGLVVVIPAYLEDDLQPTLDSICACYQPDIQVAVLIVVNASINASEQVVAHQKETIRQIEKYLCHNASVNIYAVEAFGLPKKHFGAGLARKIGMDLAVDHFIRTENKDGIIVSLDADSTVKPNYLRSIVGFFSHTQNNACSIRFAHPTQGDDFDEDVYAAITQYELHLRYYVQALRFIGFPYAFHTIGSCFACTAAAYVSVGGMNRRQGGEEFYFIQKLVQQGAYAELNTTCVYPSPRMSSRVPFGTGPSVKKMIDNAEHDYMTYNLQGFIDLKDLFDRVEEFYQIPIDKYNELILNLPGRVRSFLVNSNFYMDMQAVGNNCSTLEVFKKRFYEVFTAFKLVKYINYTHEHFLDRMPVFDAAIELLDRMGLMSEDIFEDAELLQKYRELQNGK
ncbi:Glycosyl transferase family 2 [Saccharicrinis carchari]|uniref:Glycosyl transferase family 2 n=1 Tax=Saccharicrinis carchari TaxID=1168039 RepID=A0A521AE73_SACCC|nr:glycosyltransferase [Saccharicrinis carchari]SMO33115.1 Glycosyl transferase family 2 [Saccharicrinis carchari]